MPFFPVDDRFHAHPKAQAASLAALGLWVVAGSWCNDQTTDGYVPSHVLPSLARGQTELADELVAAGLWRRKGAGYRFHQYLADGDGSHRNISRSEVESLRAKKSSGGLIGNHRRWHEARSVTDPDCPICQGKPLSEDRSDSDRSTEGGSESGPNPKHPTPPHPTKPSRSPAVSDDDPDWSEFWSTYPLPRGKGQARRAWKTAIKKADPAEIIAGARRYRDDPTRKPDYTAHPSTWLNGERWTDQAAAHAAPTATERRPAWWDR